MRSSSSRAAVIHATTEGWLTVCPHSMGSGASS